MEQPMTRLPGFLIIGAAKSGSTTLYEDLRTHPNIFMPENKEPGNLTEDRVLTKRGQDEYARLFKGARPDQICGEASTVYSQLPKLPHVPDRAMKLLGKELRIIYIIRDPIVRIRSQHHNLYLRHEASPDINLEVRREPRYLDMSRYAMQAEPWIEKFGQDRVLILKFEEYMANRTVAAVERFLGVQELPDRVEPAKIYNQTDGTTQPNRLGKLIHESLAYRKLVRPLLPDGARGRLRSVFLAQMPKPFPLTPETVEFLIHELADDLKRQPNLFRFPKPFWSESDLRAAALPKTRSGT
jgi:hypothetical protein